MIFDSHAHLVSDDFTRYPPTPLSGTLDRKLDDPMTAERLLREMDALGIERAVAVQRAHVYGYHNDYVCDSAAKYPDRLVAVCCIDAAAADAPARVQHWIGERGAVGLRLTEPHKGADMSWFAGPASHAAWLAARAHRASVCLHVYRWNRVEAMRALVDVAREFHDVPIIVDHVSNLAAEEGAPNHGIDEALAALVPLANVSFKFTTINYGKLKAAAIDAAPVTSAVVARFGAGRVMWGSDVAQSPGSYAELVQLGTDATAGLDAASRRAVLHDTGLSVYGGKWK